MERAGNLKEGWILCPTCEYRFNVELTFWEDRFKNVKLICPKCKKSFDKNKSPKSWGLPQG